MMGSKYLFFFELPNLPLKANACLQAYRLQLLSTAGPDEVSFKARKWVQLGVTRAPLLLSIFLNFRAEMHILAIKHITCWWQCSHGYCLNQVGRQLHYF